MGVPKGFPVLVFFPQNFMTRGTLTLSVIKSDLIVMKDRRKIIPSVSLIKEINDKSRNYIYSH